MLKHELAHLKQELDGPRLSRWRSTLGIAVASAVLGSFDDAPSGTERQGSRNSGEAPPSAASVSWKPSGVSETW
jgi:hypothetical protein